MEKKIPESFKKAKRICHAPSYYKYVHSIYAVLGVDVEQTDCQVLFQQTLGLFGISREL